MTPEQLGHFRRLLNSQRTAVNRLLNQEVQDAVEVSSDPGDPGEGPIDTLLADIALTHADHATDTFNEIERALVRLDRGGYGICERCGKEIEIKRLEALPATPTCASCARLDHLHDKPPSTL